MLAGHDAGRWQRVEVLLRRRAGRAAIDLQDKYGYTALMHAARRGHLAVVRRLLREGADTDLRTKGGRTALQLAELHQHPESAALIRAATSANKRRALEHWRRAMPRVAFMSKVRQVVAEVRYRPGGSGYKSSRASFEAAASEQQQAGARS